MFARVPSEDELRFSIEPMRDRLEQKYLTFAYRGLHLESWDLEAELVEFNQLLGAGRQPE